MADITFGDAPDSVAGIQSRYMEQVQKRRLYGGLTLLIFVVLMVSPQQWTEPPNRGINGPDKDWTRVPEALCLPC